MCTPKNILVLCTHLGRMWRRIQNCSNKFSPSNVKFIIGIIKFAAYSFQRTFASWKVALILKFILDFPQKHQIWGLISVIVGFRNCTIKCTFCICWKSYQICWNLHVAITKSQLCNLRGRKRVSKCFRANQLSRRNWKLPFWHFKLSKQICRTHFSFYGNVLNGIYDRQIDNPKLGKWFSKWGRVILLWNGLVPFLKECFWLIPTCIWKSVFWNGLAPFVICMIYRHLMSKWQIIILKNMPEIRKTHFFFIWCGSQTRFRRAFLRTLFCIWKSIYEITLCRFCNCLVMYVLYFALCV